MDNERLAAREQINPSTPSDKSDLKVEPEPMQLHPRSLRRPSYARELAPGYLWNSTTQELIPILSEDHPGYRQNEEIIAAAIRRWNGGTSR
jgi:hypothetical protein